jgi:3-deoxy-D-manno-octulosonic acid kinase
LCQAPGFSARIQGIAKRELLKNFVIPAQGKTFMAKVYTNKDLGRFLLSMCHFGEAERNGSTLAYLANQSIYVTRPLCLLREYRNGLVSKSVLFLEKLPETAIDYKTYLPETLPGQSQPFRINFFAQAGRAIGQMHKTGVYTEDTDQNLMVEKKGNVFTFHFLDFDNFYPWRIPTRNRTIHAISHAVDTGKQIKYTCNALETEAFVNAYLAARGKPQWYQTIMDALKTSRPHIFEHPTCPPVNA